MALVVPLSDLINKLTTDESLPSFCLNNKKTNNFLIIQNSGSIRSNGGFSATIQLQSCPAVSCSIQFTCRNYNLEGNFKFSSDLSNLQYEMSLYYINSKNTIEFLETLCMTDTKMDSSFCLKRAYTFFDYNHHLLPDKSVNGQLQMLISFKSKDSISINVEIPKNEIAEHFASFYEDRQLTDFKIICGDKKFEVHKVVLAARCTVFRAMFQHENKESRDNQVEITDFEPKIVEEMISFLYKDEINTRLTQEELEELLMIADKYSLEKLKMICMQEMTRTVDNVSDALEAFWIAKSYNVPKFKEAVLQFIEERQQFPEISKPEE